MKEFKMTALLFFATLPPTPHMLRDNASIKITDRTTVKTVDVFGKGIRCNSN